MGHKNHIRVPDRGFWWLIRPKFYLWPQTSWNQLHSKSPTRLIQDEVLLLIHMHESHPGEVSRSVQVTIQDQGSRNSKHTVGVYIEEVKVFDSLSASELKNLCAHFRSNKETRSIQKCGPIWVSRTGSSFVPPALQVWCSFLPPPDKIFNDTDFFSCQ